MRTQSPISAKVIGTDDGDFHKRPPNGCGRHDDVYFKILLCYIDEHQVGADERSRTSDLLITKLEFILMYIY